jgi:anti-sigma B factor antagonist
VGQHFRVDVRSGQGRVILGLHGELDIAAAPQLGAEIARAQSESGSEAIVLDLADLQFIDSSGLRAILTAHERAREAGRELAVTPGGPQVARLLEIAGVGGILRLVPSADAALTGEPAAPER